LLTRAAGWLLAPLLFLVTFALQPSFLMGDFRAFYCAGAAISQGADPYRAEPLRTCERNAGPPAEPAALHGVALPAPLPPYALLPFAALSRLPFPVAIAVYTSVLLAAMSASVVFLARITGATTLTLNIVFAAITAVFTYYLGQPVPLVFLALSAAALLVRKRSWIAASACALAATMEPHMALPALLAMLVAFPRTRLPVVVGGAVLLVAGAYAVGAATSIEYVREVVPAHALANAFEWQFSLTSILTSLDVSAAVATRWGEIMFGLMTLLGIVVALRMRRLTGDNALVVIIPPAFAIFGGVHVHYQQLAIAFPAVLYVIVRYPQVRALATAGLALAMIPWNVMSTSLLVGASPLLAGAFAGMLLGPRRGIYFAAAAALIGFAFLALASAGYGPPLIAFTPHPSSPEALAEVSWGDFSHAILMRSSVMMQWLRLPTLLGLAAGLLAIARIAFPADARANVAARAARQLSATS
jgi:Glycosyltransferase family 87